MNKLFNNYNAWDPFELFPVPKEIDLSKFNKVAAGPNPDSALAMNQRTKSAIKRIEDKIIEDTYNGILKAVRKEADEGNYGYIVYYDKSLDNKYFIIADRLREKGYNITINSRGQSSFDNFMEIKW
jgi:hypothetical protein